MLKKNFNNSEPDCRPLNKSKSSFDHGSENEPIGDMRDFKSSKFTEYPN